MAFTVTPLDGCIGARVTGLNLHATLDDATLADLKTAWVKHKVLVLPDQNITDEEHVAFAKRFGELEVHHQKIIKDSANPAIFKVSNVDENNNIRPPASDVMTQLLLTKMWHTDSSFREVPCMGSIRETNKARYTVPTIVGLRFRPSHTSIKATPLIFRYVWRIGYIAGCRSIVSEKNNDRIL